MNIAALHPSLRENAQINNQSTIWQVLELCKEEELNAIAECCIDKMHNKEGIYQYINQCAAMSGKSLQSSRIDKAYKHCLRELGADSRASVLTELISALSSKEFAEIKQWIKQSA